MQNKLSRQEKREILISLSRKAKLIKKVRTERAKTENEKLFWASRTVNQMLMLTVYNPNKKLVFKKFNEWKAEGKTILKGSKSIVVWAQPLGELKADQVNEDDYMNFFPMCYLFSNLQVK